MTLQLKVDFKARGNFVKIWSSEQLIEAADWLECVYGSADDFPGRQQIGIQPSAIRYYEQIGLLPPAQRLSGQRRYDSTVLYRLTIIQRARQLGFSLTEIRQLFFGFRDVTRASERWQTLSQRKLEELEHLTYAIKAVRTVLKQLMTKCRCETLDQCGKGMFQSMKRDVAAEPLLASHRGRGKYRMSLRT